MEWYWWCLIAGAVIATLGVLRIDLNARVLAVLLILEIIIVALFDLAILGDPGPQGLSGAGFDPGNATGSALGAALVFGVASFVGFESAAIYSEEVKDPQRTVARATFIAVGAVATFYALSSWLLANAVGPETIVNPEALMEAGFTTPDGAAPDPTTVLIGSGQERLGEFWGDSAALLFATSLFAALLSFHNAVARYFFALGRENVLPSALSRVNRAGAPAIASIVQSAIALIVVGLFAVLEEDPVLKLFTWLTNLGALGVVLLMAITSFAVVAYFRGRGESAWRTMVAPIVAGVSLLVILVLGLANFNVLITGSTDAPTDSVSVILPIVLFGAGIIGLIAGAVMKRRAPECYVRIGQRTAVERAEHIE
jgi:amino acid transporter